MRILIPTVDYPPIEGGIGTVTREVARELANLGHDVTVVAPWFAEMEGFDRHEPVRVIRFRGYNLGWLRLFPLLAKGRGLEPVSDLLVAPNVAYGGVIALRSGLPYITFAYAYEFLKFKHNPVLGPLLRRVYSRAALVVAISRYSEDRLHEFGVSPERIATILPGAALPVRHAVDATSTCRRLGITPSNFILSVGRLVPRKGHDTLIRAMPRVLEQCPGTQLVVVGRGPCEVALREAARRLDLADRVVFTGKVGDEELASLYEQCTMFALPASDAGGGQVEGFGLVFTEAHAYGKPVVAGRSGGVEDAVVDGKTGLLVEPGNVEALAHAMIHLVQHPDEARRLGEAGRERVHAELNWATFTRRMLEAWEARR